MAYENSAGADSMEKDYTGKKPNSKGSKSTELQMIHGNKLTNKTGSGKVDYPKPF